MKSILLLTTQWTVFLLAGSKRIPNYAGPFNVWIERLSACSEDDNWMQMKVSHVIPNKKFHPQNWNGYFNFSRVADDMWWWRATLDVRSNNQWKENAFVFDFPRQGCSKARENFPYAFMNLFTEKGKPCHLLQQVVIYRNTSIEMQLPHFPILAYGNYRGRLEAGTQEEKDSFYCGMGIGHIMPKVTQ